MYLPQSEARNHSKTCFFYAFVKLHPSQRHSKLTLNFYTFVNPKGSKSSKDISTPSFSILPPKQEKNTSWVPYIFCRLDLSTDRDGNSPRIYFLSKHENSKNQKDPNHHESKALTFTPLQEGITLKRSYKYTRLLLSPTEAGEKHSPGSLYFLPLGYFHRQGR